VLTAQEEERTRISRDLHDGLGQIVAALHFEINWLRSRADEGSVATADFEKAVALIDRAGDKLRAICRGLRPPMLDDLGLLPAIRQLADEFAEHWPLEIRLDVRVDEDRLPLPSDVALCTFRVLQEALTNVARHSDASKVDVTLQRDGTMLVMSVYDNGRGFDPARLAGAPGFGIEGMRERARLVDGELELHSAPDRGTRVVFRAPLPLPKEEAVP
jgi:signal transduction histidine kinase